MSRSIIGVAARWSKGPWLWVAAGVASTTAAAVGLGGAGTAFADVVAHAVPAPVVTRAALDPSLVTGRGASVDFTEQEAENAATNGTIIGPDRSAWMRRAAAASPRRSRSR